MDVPAHGILHLEATPPLVQLAGHGAGVDAVLDHEVLELPDPGEVQLGHQRGVGDHLAPAGERDEGELFKFELLRGGDGRKPVGLLPVGRPRSVREGQQKAVGCPARRLVRLLEGADPGELQELLEGQ